MNTKRLITITLISILALGLTIHNAIADTTGNSGLVGLDSSFDGDGIVTTSIQGSDSGDMDYDAYGFGMAFQPDGKILVTGVYFDGDDKSYYFDLFLARYCQNGTLDNGVNCGSPAFGTNGMSILRIGAEYTHTYDAAVVVLADGKILVGGDVQLASTKDFFLARFTSNGAIDTSYGGGDGIFYYDNNGNQDIFKGLRQLPNGNILIGGYSYSMVSDYSLTLMEIDQNGNLVNSFNNDGIASFQIASTNTNLNCFTVQPDGKIVVGGYIWPGSILITRLTSNGDLDTTFSAGDGTDGYYLNDLTANNDGVTSLAVQPDGKILAAAYSYVNTNPVNSNIVLFRFNSDGSLDADFDGDSGSGNGIVSTQVVTNSNNMPSEIQVQSDGKIIVGGGAGDEYSNAQDIAVLRYTSNGMLDTDFNTSGFVTTNITDNDYWGSGKLTPDGKLVVAGYSGQGYYYDVTVLRYLTAVTETGASAFVDTGAFTQIGNSNIWAQFDSGHACTSGVITATKTLDYPGGSGNTGELPFYWDLSTSCSGEYSLNLMTCYTDEELTSQFALEENLALYKFIEGVWINQNGTVNSALNCVNKNGVTALSSWTITDPTEMGGPTAVQVKTLEARTPMNFKLLLITACVLVIGLCLLAGTYIRRWQYKKAPITIRE